MGLQEDIRVLVAGPGALGTALAAALRRRHADVRCLGRAGPKMHEARFDDAEGTELLRLPAPDAAWCAGVRLAFVAVKAYDLDAAMRAAAARVPAGAALVPVANGAVEDVVAGVARDFPGLHVRLGFATFGVSEAGPGHYALRSRAGDVSFGPRVAVDAPTPAERAVTEPAGFFSWHANVAKLVRRKWVYNVVINTLTAARGLARNGDLLHDLPTLAAAFNEAYDLATELWGAPPLGRREMFQGLEQLIDRTADNENSMARDRRLGRRTESEFLAGLARDGRRYPLLAELHARIQSGQRTTSTV